MARSPAPFEKKLFGKGFRQQNGIVCNDNVLVAVHLLCVQLCYPDTRVEFQVLFAVSQKILTNRTPAPESDTDTRTRVHVTLVYSLS